MGFQARAGRVSRLAPRHGAQASRHSEKVRTRERSMTDDARRAEAERYLRMAMEEAETAVRDGNHP